MGQAETAYAGQRLIGGGLTLCSPLHHPFRLLWSGARRCLFFYFVLSPAFACGERLSAPFSLHHLSATFLWEALLHPTLH